jgi:hypothetical protein
MKADENSARLTGYARYSIVYNYYTVWSSRFEVWQNIVGKFDISKHIHFLKLSWYFEGFKAAKCHDEMA